MDCLNQPLFWCPPLLICTRGPCNFGREAAWGAGTSVAPLPTGSAGLVGLLEDLRPGPLLEVGLLRLQAGLTPHPFRFFAFYGGLMGLAVASLRPSLAAALALSEGGLAVCAGKA